jgi:signal peptidase
LRASRDIVKFTVEGDLIVHRIVEIAGDAGQPVFVTQGDNNNTMDAPITAAQIEGRVAFSVPKVGWLQIWLRKLVGVFR